MAKKKKTTPKRDATIHVTKRRLARWQRERRRRRIYTGIGVLVIAVVLAVLVYGLAATGGTPAGEWVTTVGDARFHGDDYVDALLLCQIGFGPSTNDSQEDPIVFLEINELVRQGAAEAGISVSDDQIDAEIINLVAPNSGTIDEQLYQQMLSGLGLTDAQFRDAVEMSLMEEKLNQYLQALVPKSAEHVHAYVMSLNSTAQVNVVAERLNLGEDFFVIAEDYLTSDLGWLPPGLLTPQVEEVVFALEIGEVSEPIHTGEVYSIITVTEKEVRDIDEEVRERLQEDAFLRWFLTEADEKVVRNPELDLESLYGWALEQLAERVNAGQ